jgi:putative Mg2+ transporter-C (MgtC) family protein
VELPREGDRIGCWKMTHADVVLLGRIALAAAIGYAVGFEREFRGSRAGDRTFALVAMGSAAITGLGVELFPTSAEKVIAGVITGLGFLGAGVIFRGMTGEPMGLTTAASLWATAAAGILAGAGRALLGVLMTLLVLGILELGHIPAMRRLDDRIHQRHEEEGPHPG